MKDKTEFEELRYALDQALKLQSHYAGILNQYDGGTRMQFPNVETWLERLRSTAPEYHKLTVWLLQMDDA